MLRLKSDLLAALLATADGALDGIRPALARRRRAHRRHGRQGLPRRLRKGTEIRGLDAAAKVPGVEIFHAGTRRDGDRLLADGGRVLNVTGAAQTVAEAQARAYEASPRSTGPAASAAAISAGERWSGRKSAKRFDLPLKSESFVRVATRATLTPRWHCCFDASVSLERQLGRAG